MEIIEGENNQIKPFGDQEKIIVWYLYHFEALKMWIFFLVNNLMFQKPTVLSLEGFELRTPGQQVSWGGSPRPAPLYMKKTRTMVHSRAWFQQPGPNGLNALDLVYLRDGEFAQSNTDAMDLNTKKKNARTSVISASNHSLTVWQKVGHFSIKIKKKAMLLILIFRSSILLHARQFKNCKD